MPTPIDRRGFLRQGAVAAGAVSVAAPFQALVARTRDNDRNRWKNVRRGCSPDYGPLSPARDETTGLPLLQLPEGFEYLTFGWTGDLMSDGTPTPGSHDGMAAFGGRPHRVHLIRNHERSGSTDAFAPDIAYDPFAGGGTTTLEFDSKRGRFISDRPSLSGTVRNCAGGPTPWGAWLTCEETLDQPATGNDLTKPTATSSRCPCSTGQPRRRSRGWVGSCTKRSRWIRIEGRCTRRKTPPRPASTGSRRRGPDISRKAARSTCWRSLDGPATTRARDRRKTSRWMSSG